MKNPKPIPGYCHQLDKSMERIPSGNEWKDSEITVYLEKEYTREDYVGTRYIDGSMHYVFYVGCFRNLHRYIAQLAIYFQ